MICSSLLFSFSPLKSGTFSEVLVWLSLITFCQQEWLLPVLEIPLPSQPCNSRPASSKPVPLKQAEMLLITQLAESPRAGVWERAGSCHKNIIKRKTKRKHPIKSCQWQSCWDFFAALYSLFGKIWRYRPFYLQSVCNHEHQWEKIQCYHLKLQLMQVQQYSTTLHRALSFYTNQSLWHLCNSTVLFF